jgi:hypothetical protein
MQKRSNRGSGEPVWVNASVECAVLIRDPIRGKHEGQRSYAPHQQAGQMTAPDQSCIDIEKTLANQAPSTDDPLRTFPETQCLASDTQCKAYLNLRKAPPNTRFQSNSPAMR